MKSPNASWTPLLFLVWECMSLAYPHLTPQTYGSSVISVANPLRQSRNYISWQKSNQYPHDFLHPFLSLWWVSPKDSNWGKNYSDKNYFTVFCW